MKDPRLAAAQDSLLARGICKPEAAPAGLLTGRADNGNALRHHNLVSDMGVQISRGHEAGLGGMSVDPADDEQFLFIAVVEELLLVERLARVARACLFGDDQSRDEEGVVLEDSTEHAACF